MRATTVRLKKEKESRDEEGGGRFDRQTESTREVRTCDHHHSTQSFPS
jgi:hypothetical protein